MSKDYKEVCKITEATILAFCVKDGKFRLMHDWEALEVVPPRKARRLVEKLAPGKVKEFFPRAKRKSMKAAPAPKRTATVESDTPTNNYVGQWGPPDEVESVEERRRWQAREADWRNGGFGW